MIETITPYEMAERILRLTATTEGASDIAVRIYEQYCQSESDADRMTILLLGLRTYEGTLRDTRKIAVELMQKVGPSPVVIVEPPT